MYQIKGKISWFGGKDDSTMTKGEVWALYQWIKKEYMDYPVINKMYCAMRWDYEGIEKALHATNRGEALNVLRHSVIKIDYYDNSVNLYPVDWGPHPDTTRVIDVSHKAMQLLNCKTDDEVIITLPDYIKLK